MSVLLAPLLTASGGAADPAVAAQTVAGLIAPTVTVLPEIGFWSLQASAGARPVALRRLRSLQEPYSGARLSEAEAEAAGLAAMVGSSHYSHRREKLRLDESIVAMREVGRLRGRLYLVPTSGDS